MKLVLVNQFGEQSAQAITSQLLFGYSTGANQEISASDSILTALANLQAQILGNAQSEIITDALLTDLALDDATPVTEDDSILVAIGKLQAQIDNLP